MIPKTPSEQLAIEAVWFANAVKLAEQLIVIARKSVSLSEDGMWIMPLFGTLANLEHHLNPRRLRFGDLDRTGVSGSGVLRCHGLQLLKTGLDGVLVAYQLTPICHDGAIYMSSDPDDDTPVRPDRQGQHALWVGLAI